jgi:hypothetical protein
MTNRRIRSIFWLMTACIVAINAFQGYWLLTTYRLNRQQFGNTVQDALFQVIEGHQIDNARTLLGKHRPGRPGGRISNESPGVPDVPPRAVPGKPPGGVAKDARVLFRRLGAGAGSRFYYQFNNDSVTIAPADTLARRISRFVVQEWTEGGRVDLRKIYSAYHAELLRRNIDVAFTIDTLSILPKAGGNNLIIYNGYGLDPEKRWPFQDLAAAGQSGPAHFRAGYFRNARSLFAEENGMVAGLFAAAFAAHIGLLRVHATHHTPAEKAFGHQERFHQQHDPRAQNAHFDSYGRRGSVVAFRSFERSP